MNSWFVITYNPPWGVREGKEGSKGGQHVLRIKRSGMNSRHWGYGGLTRSGGTQEEAEAGRRPWADRVRVRAYAYARV